MNAALISLFLFGTLACTEPADITDNYVKPKAVNFTSVVYENGQHNYINVLKTLGYYREESSDEDLNVRNAILRFQSSCNLVADGIIGDNSRSALEARMALSGSYRYPDKVMKPASKSFWITINRSKRILTIYKGSQVVKKYPITVGKEESKTPEGKFRVNMKGKNPYWSGGKTGKPAVQGGSPDNPLGRRWIGLSVGTGDLYGIHGNNKPFSIGKQVSNGCIRMINSDVVELYNLVDINDPVWIGTGETLEKWGVEQAEFY